jgi:hypothetical protein
VTVADFDFTFEEPPESTRKALDAAWERMRAIKIESGHADRYKCVRDGFWWRIKIGTGTETIGKFYTRMECERMVLQLQRAFGEGIYVACRPDAERASTEGETE